MLVATELVGWLPSAGAAAFTMAAVILTRVLRRRSAGATRRLDSFRVEVVAIGITIVGLLATIVLLPEPVDSQLALSVVGLVLTGLVAISSQSIIANAMAGLMLRSVKNFRAGDFIEVVGHTGRVSELGLFHTEIQTPDRDLITLPNALMVREPVRVVRSSGTIVSATVSLGYDVPHKEVRRLLRTAGFGAELGDPFVQILDLGDHAVQYRVGGFLEDTTHLLATRSELRAAVLDTLSDAGIEIVSPLHVASRDVNGQLVIPAATRTPNQVDVPAANARVFDKAEAARRLESTLWELGEAEEQLRRLNDERSELAEADREPIETRIAAQERRLEGLRSLVGFLSDPTTGE